MTATVAGGVERAVGVPGREGSLELTTVDVGVSVMIAPPDEGRHRLRRAQGRVKILKEPSW